MAGGEFYFLTRISHIYEIVCFLNEKIQTHKRLISFIRCVRIDKSTERESKLVAVQDWEGMRALRNDR